MLRRAVWWIGIVLGALGYLEAASQQQASSKSAPPVASPNRALLNRYCVTCHNEKLRTADLTLDKVDVDNVREDAAVWEKVIRKLQAGQMPPTGMPRPDGTAINALVTYLETALDREATNQPNPGRTAGVHRLNRTEYRNAVRDLLSVEVDTESLLPPDDSGYGFDNIGDALSVSPLLLERYLSAAGKISRLAIGDPDIRPAVALYEPPKQMMQEDRMSENLPFGSRGGMAIRHRFPVDGEYTIKVLLERNHREYIIGLAEPHQLNIHLDSKKIKQFTVGGEHKGVSGPIFASAGQVGDTEQETYEHTADAGLEWRTAVKAGSHLVGVAFQKNAVEPEGAIIPHFTGFEKNQWKGGDPAVGAIVISGPFNVAGSGVTASRSKIFVCQPAAGKEEPCAKKILSTLARRAYRRPVTDHDLQPLLGIYRAGRREGRFEAGIGDALQAILVNPDFLTRIEREPANSRPDTPYAISDLELASRLSFFIWSSIPDEELLSLAERGKLRDPVVLEQQVKRMMADVRSKALVDNFAGQWLYLRNLAKVSPDEELFRDFDDNLREAFQQETELFFEYMLREDQSLLRLLDADYTFVNERLARHYGIPDIYGSHFRRVHLTDENRRGLLGQGSILTVTSYANRTSPVLRGKWVLEQMLGTPPPPPPPDVPALEEKNKEGKSLTMRQAMEQHRANPVCASCHRLMDPIGFALENFDAIGQWRSVSKETNTPIDASGVLPNGMKFQGVADLRKILLSQPEQFARTLTEKLLTYALGRGPEYYDGPVIRNILREAATKDYRWSSIVLGIVKSSPFQMRRSRPS